MTYFQFRLIQGLLAEFSAEDLLSSGVVIPDALEQYRAYR